MSIEKLADVERVFLLQASLGILKCKKAINDAMIRHQCVPKYAFDIIDDFPLVINFLVKVEQLFALQCLNDLRLFDCERLLLSLHGANIGMALVQGLISTSHRIISL